MLSKEALQIAEERRESKDRKGKKHPCECRVPKNSKGRRESLPKGSVKTNRGKQQNEKDQRSLQENQRYQGNISHKIGIIKDRNGTDLTDADNIKKGWQKYTEELYEKDLNDPDNHNGVLTHLEPDILECEFQ